MVGKPDQNGFRPQVPCVGITYVWTDEGGLYLAVVLELYSSRIIGRVITDRVHDGNFGL